MSRRMNLEGQRYGKLVASKYTCTKETNGMSYYLCKCDCGCEVEVSHGNLRSGKTKSCGCISRQKGKDSPRFVHGMRKSKAYKSWCKIKERCYNPNNPDYYNYGAIGVKLQDSFKEDFTSFFAEVGEPTDKNSSIDRIDNNLGYVAGNMRWATVYQQARNKSKAKNNTSGITGVNFYVASNPGRSTYTVAQWHDLDGRIRNKKFSVKKHGLLPAFKLAVDYRNIMIQELNKAGAEYSVSHGTEKSKLIQRRTNA